MQISFFGSIAACLVYGGGLAAHLPGEFQHGADAAAYAVESEKAFETNSKKRVTWGRLIGLDEHFTFGDKLLAGGLFGWSLLWFGVFVVGTAWNIIAPWPISVWSQFWFVVGIGITIFFAVATAIWFTWGGIRDMRLFFRRLKEERVDVLDNGMVVNHHNLDEKS